MSTKSPKTRSSTSTPKESILKLLNCGSGKKDSKRNSKIYSPSNAPESKDEEDGPSSNEITTVKAFLGHALTEDEVEISYNVMRLIGKGTFGKVYKARFSSDGSLMAIKKVLDDKRYKNRELMFMKRVQHPNIVDLKYYFYGDGEGCRSGERYLNMLLEFVPETLFSVTKCDGQYTKPLLEPIFIKLYMYQMLRSLNYLHSLNICHRDIKPQNLLLNTATHEIKLCDFGSAKELFANESNIAYICSRYYRAPELLFGSQNYSTQIDMWSGGCVISELYQGVPLFPGSTGPDQMAQIIRVLGTPSHDDIYEINQTSHIRLPSYLPPLPWNKVFTKTKPSPDALDLMYKLLVYSPSHRLTPLEAMCHPYFDQIRSTGYTLPDGKSPPQLFNFTNEELQLCPTIRDRLQPVNSMQSYNNNNVLEVSPQGGKTSISSSDFKSKIIGLARSSFRISGSKDKSPSKKFSPDMDFHDHLELSHSMNDSIDIPKFDIDNAEDDDNPDSSKKRRRRRKDNNNSVSQQLEDLNIDVDNVKKSRPKLPTEIGLDDAVEILDENHDDKSKKKKHRHRRTESQDLNNSQEDLNSPVGVETETSEKRKKKKTREIEEVVTTTVTTVEDGVAKTKTKKSKRNKKIDYSNDDSFEDLPVVRAIV